MSDGGITVRGIPEVQGFLRAFPNVLVMGCFAKALSRAGGVFEAELRANMPETDYSTSSEEYGHLLDNLLSEVIIDTKGQGGKVKVGFGRKGMIAMWVEFGHRMLSHDKKPTKLDRVKANPFMRRAFAAAADAAVDAFIETVREFMQSGVKAA
jgi:hypothetical protein